MIIVITTKGKGDSKADEVSAKVFNSYKSRADNYRVATEYMITVHNVDAKHWVKCTMTDDGEFIETGKQD